MEIQSAVNFVIGSILFSVGFIVIGATIVAMNNLFSKYWKSIKWQVFNPADYTVVDHDTIEELKRTLAKNKEDRNDPR
jgi:hypothetical protein